MLLGVTRDGMWEQSLSGHSRALVKNVLVRATVNERLPRRRLNPRPKPSRTAKMLESFTVLNFRDTMKV